MAREQAVKRRQGNEIEFGRIVAFSDGVFAIAITLLVLGLGVQKGLSDGQLTSELFDLWDNLLAFAISFAVIGRFWVVHHRFFAEVDAFDGRLLGVPGAPRRRLPLAAALPRSLGAAGAAIYFRRGTVKLIERPGRAQETDRPRSVTTAWQR